MKYFIGAWKALKKHGRVRKVIFKIDSEAP